MHTNPTASQMAKIRWEKATPEQRRAHSALMHQARWHSDPKARKKKPAPVQEKSE